MAHPGGRPTDYNLELAEEICDVIANTSKGLKVLCKENKHWPDQSTVKRWMRKHKEFCTLYMQAKMDQATFMAEEIIEISDDDSKDTITKIDKDGNEYQTCNTEYIARSRLRVDSRKWLASKLAPKVYGERSIQEHDVKVRQEDVLKELD